MCVNENTLTKIDHAQGAVRSLILEQKVLRLHVPDDDSTRVTLRAQTDVIESEGLIWFNKSPLALHV